MRNPLPKWNTLTLLQGVTQKGLHKLDLFGTPVPTLNLGGKQVINTSMGGVLSFGLLFVTVLFALSRLELLLERKGALVVEFVDIGGLEADT